MIVGMGTSPPMVGTDWRYPRRIVDRDQGSPLVHLPVQFTVQFTVQFSLPGTQHAGSSQAGKEGRAVVELCAVNRPLHLPVTGTSTQVFEYMY